MKNKQGGSMLHLELTVVKTMLRIIDFAFVTSVNIQSSFTVQNPRASLVEIGDMIYRYLATQVTVFFIENKGVFCWASAH